MRRCRPSPISSRSLSHAPCPGWSGGTRAQSRVRPQSSSPAAVRDASVAPEDPRPHHQRRHDEDHPL